MPDTAAAIRITSLQTPRVKQALGLRKRSDRDAAGLMLVEGYREILRAYYSGAEVAKIY